MLLMVHSKAPRPKLEPLLDEIAMFLIDGAQRSDLHELYFEVLNVFVIFLSAQVQLFDEPSFFGKELFLFRFLVE